MIFRVLSDLPGAQVDLEERIDDFTVNHLKFDLLLRVRKILRFRRIGDAPK